MDKPVVSVIMAVRNGQRYVRQAVESILQQTFSEFDFVVVDDGSTDRTPARLKQCGRHDGRLCLIRAAGQGIARSRNEAVSMARGRYLAIIDSDDVAEPTRLAKQVEALETRPPICIGSAVRIIDGKGRWLTVLEPPASDEAIQESVLAGHGAIYNPSAMMARADFERVGGYHALYEPAEDIDLWLRLGERGTLANLKEPLLRYRMHDQSISESKTVTQRQRANLACEHACQRRGVKPRYEAWTPWRPGNDRQSQHAFMLQYGWWAFQAQQYGTAAVYAGKALLRRPLNREGWALAYHTGIGVHKREEEAGV